MGIKSKELETVELSVNDKIKAKRGRKSKKELLTALNVESLVKKIDTKKINQPQPENQIQNQNTINLNISEIVSNNDEDSNNIYDSVLIKNELTKNTKIEEINVLKKKRQKTKGRKNNTTISIKYTSKRR